MDPTLCPLCGQPNRCAMEMQKETGVAQPPCWCVGLDFTSDFLARVPTDAKDQACICATCQQKALRP